MPKPLRVISVNFQFQDTSVVCVETLDRGRSLFDFDAVVIRPHSLRPFIRNILPSGGELFIGDTDYHAVAGVMKVRAAELARLLEQGGVLVIILDEAEAYRFQTPGRDVQRLTNYELLDYFPAGSVRNGAGTGISLTEGNEPFVDVLRASDVCWTAYMLRGRPDPLWPFRVFAENGRDAFVGAKVRVSEGHVILLPNLEGLDEDLFLQACREYRFAGELTPAPAWVSPILLPGEEDLQSKVESIRQEQRKLEASLGEVAKQLGEVAKFKGLLFEKGKTCLEPIVRDAFDLLGFKTTPAEIIQETNFEIDGRTTVGSRPGIIEIKGSKNQIPLDEFSTLPIKVLTDFQKSGKHGKGIFVGNGLCTVEPQMRLGEKVFSPHVLDAAKTNSVALLNSVELFCLVSSIQAGEAIDCGMVRESILSGLGYVDLKPFCKRLAF